MKIGTKSICFNLLILIAGTACGLGTLSGPPQAESGGDSTPAAAETPGLPVSINEGLASLDSYSLTYTSEAFDSISQQRTVTKTLVLHDGNADADFTRTETRVTDADDQILSEDVQEQIVIGDQSCALAYGEAELTTLSPTERTMADLMSRVVVIRPLIENPVLVGEEVMSGVPVRTYTFEVRSLDSGTEVEASRADGVYALAVDGDYLVHYRLDLELRTGAEDDPDAEVSAILVEMLLESINQPVSIEFPPECQAAGSSE